MAMRSGGVTTPELSGAGTELSVGISSRGGQSAIQGISTVLTMDTTAQTLTTSVIYSVTRSKISVFGEWYEREVPFTPSLRVLYRTLAMERVESETLIESRSVRPQTTSDFTRQVTSSLSPDERAVVEQTRSLIFKHKRVLELLG